MSIYIDKKYISLLAPKLTLFKQRGEFLWNFRCPVCGDSNKDKTKTRGYIYKRKEHFSFMCHNCGSSMALTKFVKYVDPALYNEYLLETFGESNTKTKVDATEYITRPVFKPSIRKINLPPISALPEEHYARKYLSDRKVPVKSLFFASDFADFISETFPEYSKPLYKEARIVIPFYDKNGNLLGVQGRSIGPSKIKYITIKANEDVPKIFGWDRLDSLQTVYVVEGPIDSLFLTNSVATMDAALYCATGILGLDLDYVFVYDNEPRNKQIVNNMRKTIAIGHKVCIWPSSTKEKDINEMVMAGNLPAAIRHIIDNNTYTGFEATIRMNQWEKL